MSVLDVAASLDALSPELRDAARALVDAASAAGLQPRVTSTLRSNAEQTRLYRRFLAGASGFPVAPPGFSAHEYGLAFDMVVTPMEALADVGYTWQQWGGGWNQSDAIHFELPGASEQAKQLGSAGGYEQHSFRDWILKLYGEIPWYIAALLPMSTTTAAADQPYTQEQVLKILKKYGLA